MLRVETETQLTFMKQKVSQLESELSEKDKKWKSASTEKDAEISKKLTDYKEKVIFYFI